MSPERIYHTLKATIKKEWIICFFTAMILGLITHMYQLTNSLPNWDSLNNFYSDQNTIHLGRCFLTIACGITSFYDLYWLNGFLSLIYIGITAAIVGETLSLKKPATLILMSGFLVTFPSVTSTLAYTYTADGYFLGMLCMTLAIFLTIRYKRGWIPGVFLICFGLGIYQAFITFAILLVLIWSIDQLLFQDTKLPRLWNTWGKLLLCGGLGGGLYFICFQILLLLENKALADYQGISEAASGTSLNLLGAFWQCIIDFAYFFIGSLDKLGVYAFLNIVLFLFLLLFGILAIGHRRVCKESLRFFLLLFCVFAIPFCSFALYFISPELNYHMLTLQSLCFVFILFTIFYERTVTDSVKKQSFIQWSVLILSSIIIYNFILIANISYQTMQLSYEKSYGLIQRMAMRMEELEGFETCTELAVIGTLQDSMAVSFNLPPDMTGFTEGYIMSSPLHFQSMLKNYCGIELDLVDQDRLEEMKETESYQNMKSWPRADSIQIKDHVLIIKIGELRTSE